jgi:predicted O-linked N-acetylglucosamine transferase (SPINDLY family)
MSRLPNSTLIFHAGEGAHRQRVHAQFAQAGVDPSRVRFSGRIPIDNYMGQYDQIDIALDPFPYPGGTTTCDAVYMGVPVMTLAGPSAASRGGVSILSNLGLQELIANTPERYIEIAVALANDKARLTDLRANLRGWMNQSPLMDAPGFARDVESAYRQMWKTWCSRRQ